MEDIRTGVRMRAAIVVLFSVFLSGCFQAQLNGPVAGATVTVSALTDPNTVYASATSWDPDYIIGLNNGSSWDRTTPVTRLWLLGIFQLDVNNLDDNTFYLVTASGGEDTDADRNNIMDDTYTPVVGQWRAIMSGAQLKSVGPKITALSEAIYLWLAPQLGTLNADQIATNLDRAAAQMVTADLNEDGSSDYADLLSWSPQFHKGFLQVAIGPIDQLSDLVTVGGADSERSSLAQQVLTIAITEETDISAESYFNDHIADSVLNAACQSCHIEGGPSGNTRLVFEKRGAANEDTLNAEIFSEFLTTVDGAGELLLSKVQGVDHGGGAWFTSQSEQYASLSTYIGLVTGEEAGGGPSGGFWDGLIMADARQTLRRAALIFAGRLPTEAEYNQAETGEEGLRSALRGLLQGSGFHDFLIRGANDRLHTDAFLNGLFMEVSDISANGIYPVGADKYFNDRPTNDEEQQAKRDWEIAWTVGLARAPLELIAYVVENERPYTEILTANHTMVNWQSGEFLRSGADFGGQQDNSVFKPGFNRGQIPLDENYQSEYSFDYGTRVDSHSDYVSYPHAGVLNTQAFLQRYPTTETNRNRARARWTYMHFLGVDIEKSAARTTDPEALADTNNPTLNNPACIACHQLHDPVAGTFQNYGNEGWYRSAWGGRDSLPDTYKYPQWFDEDAPPSPYQEGDTWFRDMRAPGLDGGTATNRNRSLQWLAQAITSDPRFAKATVMFWWPAVMGADVLEAPGSTSDVGYQQLLSAFNQQQTDMQSLADGLSDGFAGGSAYNLKDMLVEMAMSGWFRARGVEPGTDAGRERELEVVGTRRLLTPLELENKTRAVIGFAWGEREAFWDWDNRYSALADQYRVYYGGIDSWGIKNRARELNALMSNVATRMSLEASCGAVAFDFLKPPEERLLFPNVEPSVTPGSEGSASFSTAEGYSNRTSQFLDLPALAPGEKLLQITHNNFACCENDTSRVLDIDRLVLRRDGQEVLSIEGEDFPQYPEMTFQAFTDDQGNYYETGSPGWVEVRPGDYQQLSWNTWGWTRLPLDIDTAGNYQLELVTWDNRLSDQVGVDFSVVLSSTDIYADSAGSRALREAIQDLFAHMLGEDLDISDPEIAAAYELLAESWRMRMENGDYGQILNWPEEDCYLGDSWYQLPEEEQQRGSNDPSLMKGSWISVISYLMTHYKYLHE